MQALAMNNGPTENIIQPGNREYLIWHIAV